MNSLEYFIQEFNRQSLWHKEIVLDRNDYLKTSGTIDTNFYFVVEGSLRIFVLDEQEEHTIRFGYKNNLIAALDSFLNKQPSELYIQALKKTTVKVIKKETFVNFIYSSENNIKLYIALLEGFALQQMERERDILTNSPKERYFRVLERSPQLFQ